MFSRIGSSLISRAIGKFEKIAKQLDAGVKANRDRIATNDAKIVKLESENYELEADALRGERVAGQVRNLVS